MKCKVCSYVYEEKYEDNEIKVFKGDEDFIKIQSNQVFQIDNPKECEYGDYNYKSKIEVSLVACPKCKTVFLDI